MEGLRPRDVVALVVGEWKRRSSCSVGVGGRRWGGSVVLEGRLQSQSLVVERLKAMR